MGFRAVMEIRWLWVLLILECVLMHVHAARTKCDALKKRWKDEKNARVLCDGKRRAILLVDNGDRTYRFRMWCDGDGKGIFKIGRVVLKCKAKEKKKKKKKKKVPALIPLL